MRDLIDIAELQGKADSLLQIMTLGKGWKSEGLTYRYGDEGSEKQYYVPFDAELTDELLAELSPSMDEDERIAVLVKHGVLKEL